MEEQGSIVTIYFDNGTVLESFSRIKTQEMKEIVNNLINEYRQATTEGKAYFKDLVIERLSTSETTRIPAEKLSSLIVNISPLLGHPLF